LDELEELTTLSCVATGEMLSHKKPCGVGLSRTSISGAGLLAAGDAWPEVVHAR